LTQSAGIHAELDGFSVFDDFTDCRGAGDPSPLRLDEFKDG
jgi:hypothetical protein